MFPSLLKISDSSRKELDGFQKDILEKGSTVAESVGKGKYDAALLTPFFIQNEEMGKLQQKRWEQAKLDFQVASDAASKKGGAEAFKRAAASLSDFVEESLVARDQLMDAQAAAAAAATPKASICSTGVAAASSSGVSNAAAVSSSAAAPRSASSIGKIASAASSAPTPVKQSVAKKTPSPVASVLGSSAGGFDTDFFDFLTSDVEVLKRFLQNSSPSSVRVTCILYFCTLRLKSLAPKLEHHIKCLTEASGSGIHLEEEDLLELFLETQGLLEFVDAEVRQERTLANKSGGSTSRYQQELALMLDRIGVPGPIGLRPIPESSSSIPGNGNQQTHIAFISTIVDTLQALAQAKKVKNASSSGDKKDPAGSKASMSSAPPNGCFSCGARDHWPTSPACPNHQNHRPDRKAHAGLKTSSFSKASTSKRARGRSRSSSPARSRSSSPEGHRSRSSFSSKHRRHSSSGRRDKAWERGRR